MLLFKRRFFPFFITQFFGAFTDNLYKNALLVYLTLHISESKELSLNTNLSVALFILPMVLLSAWSGLLADRFEKRFLIVRIKLLEVAIMVVGIIAFLLPSIPLMIVVLCLLGLQSTFFGPVKYGILPERLHEDELMLGNGLVEAGTFLAILGGTLAGSYLVSKETLQLMMFAVMLAATLIGLLASLFIPAQGQGITDEKRLPPFRFWQQNIELFRYTFRQKTILLCILAISWFWLVGAALLTQIPQYAKEILNSDPSITTYLLVLFSVGIALGSLAANLLSRGRIEAGLVPVGAFILAFGLWGLTKIDSNATLNDLHTFTTFLNDPRCLPVTFSFLALAFGGGVYVVPLYALIQNRAADGYKSQMIAANNIINSLFMIAVSLVAIVLLSVFGWSLQQMFAFLLVLHLIISIWIFIVVPEFIMRCLVIVITALLYRIRVQGKENIPEHGAAIIVSNHVSYMDALILMAVIPRHVRFVMYHGIFQIPLICYIFKTARAIPIASKQENPEVFAQSFEKVHQALQSGDLVGIFPEGAITKDGQLAPFKRGVTMMLERDAVPVVPIVIGNLWGSFFSRKGGLFRGMPKKWWLRVPMLIGKPLPPETSVDELREVTLKMLQELEK